MNMNELLTIANGVLAVLNLAVGNYAVGTFNAFVFVVSVAFNPNVRLMR